MQHRVDLVIVFLLVLSDSFLAPVRLFSYARTIRVPHGPPYIYILSFSKVTLRDTN
jgi:hypothetical protein